MNEYKYLFNFVIFCKTYSGDFDRFKILKESIDKFNKDNIPFYISCPKNDKELFSKLKTGEKYKYEILTDEEILNIDKNTQNWNTQQLVKMSFSGTKIAKFYLIIDSDSYFIKNFETSDFMYDENTPYISITEGKYFKEICNLLDDKNVFDLAKKIKNYFNRNGKDYWFYHIPVMFSSEVLINLKKIDNFNNLISYSPLEIQWHGEFLLKSNIIQFKPCEPFFKCFNYQFEYNLWRKTGELESDISKNYLGIVMQNRWVKSNIYKSIFLHNFKKKLIILKHFISADKGYLKHDLKFYLNYIKTIFSILLNIGKYRR